MHLAAIKRRSTSISRQTPNAKELTKKNKYAYGLPQYIPAKDSLSILEINTVKSQKPPHRAKNRAMPLLAMLCCPQTPPSVVFRQKRKKKRSQTNSKRNLHTQRVHHRGASPLSPQVKQAPSHHPQGSPQTRQIATYATRSAATIVFPIGQPTSVHRVCRAGRTRPAAATQKRFRNTQRIPSLSLAQPPC
ncbi:hypothetical protein TcCL_Unassigned00108 [Trypanosoma cruzi]|nr:hypothetical protein TcCL_Unassigned00108 [Trypanosoma cruzi]